MLKEITRKNYQSILRLKVSEKQEAFVAPNTVSLAQALFEPSAWYRGIFDGDTPVGFLMLSIEESPTDFWIWRLMIDTKYQGKGYGTKAVEAAKEYVQSLGAPHLKVSYEPSEGNPASFYEKLGFTETGEIEEGEKVMIYRF